MFDDGVLQLKQYKNGNPILETRFPDLNQLYNVVRVLQQARKECSTAKK